jgi:hypothetical protein
MLYQVNGRIFGKLNEIQIPSIAIMQNNNGGQWIHYGLPDTDKAYFDFDIKNLCQRQRTSMTFCPKKLSRIPLTCLHHAKGTFKGTITFPLI